MAKNFNIEFYDRHKLHGEWSCHRCEGNLLVFYLIIDLCNILINNCFISSDRHEW